MQSVNQGLQAAINTYASAALALAAQPVSGFSINNSYVLFISSESSTDIYEGIDTLANHMASVVRSQISRLQTIEVYLCSMASCLTQYAVGTHRQLSRLLRVLILAATNNIHVCR